MSDPEIDQTLQAIHQNLLNVYCVLTQKTLPAVRTYTQDLKRARANVQTLRNLFAAASYVVDDDDEEEEPNAPTSDYDFTQKTGLFHMSRTMRSSLAPISSRPGSRE